MKRKPHTPDEKARLVIEVLRGERTMNEIAAENEVHPNMLARWKKEAIEGLPSVFENDSAKKRKEQKVHESELDELYAQIGKLTTQNEWLKKIWYLNLRYYRGATLLISRIKNFQFCNRSNCLKLIAAISITNPLLQAVTIY